MTGPNQFDEYFSDFVDDSLQYHINRLRARNHPCGTFDSFNPVSMWRGLTQFSLRNGIITLVDPRWFAPYHNTSTSACLKRMPWRPSGAPVIGTYTSLNPLSGLFKPFPIQDNRILSIDYVLSGRIPQAGLWNARNPMHHQHDSGFVDTSTKLSPKQAVIDDGSTSALYNTVKCPSAAIEFTVLLLHSFAHSAQNHQLSHRVTVMFHWFKDLWTVKI
jgi:hypothetical protein